MTKQVAMVTTIIRQEIEVPEGAEREDVLDFLAEYQSFRTAFQGVESLDGRFRILDLVVAEEEITELGDIAYDD
jgi:hypothetical protein